MLPALATVMANRTAWNELPAGTVISGSDASLAAVQAWMEYLVIHAKPFPHRPAPHFRKSQIRVRQHLAAA